MRAALRQLPRWSTAAARSRFPFSQQKTQFAILDTAYTASPSKLFHSSTKQLRSTRTATPRALPQQARYGRIRTRQYSSGQPAPDVTSQLGSPKAKTGLKAKLKELFTKYGYVSVGVYLALSALDFPFCFLAVRLAGPERIGQIEHQVLSSLEVVTKPVWDVIKPVAGPVVHAVGSATSSVKDGVSRTVTREDATASSTTSSTAERVSGGREAASIWTQLALAYGIHKTLLIFIRVPLTAALTPRIARTLQRWGYKVGGKSTG